MNPKFLVFLLLLASGVLGGKMAAQVPAAQHVFLVVEENHSYESVIGNGSMPELNALAQRYGLATQYYANTHPSIGNYFELTTGEIITNDDGFNGTVNLDNIVRELNRAGKSWKSYAESLPYVGYVGGDAYPYLRHHNPFTYFTDVLDSHAQQQNLVPFSHFAGDLAANRLPQFSYIVPNALDDAHDGSLAQADQWLQRNISPILNSAAFQNNGLLIIVFDESNAGDHRHGGGRVAMVVCSPRSKAGYRSTTFYQHPSTLKLILQSLGVNHYPGASNGAPGMGEFFGSGGGGQGCLPGAPGVEICKPANGGTVPSPVEIKAGAVPQSGKITAIRVYVDNNPVLTVDNNTQSSSFQIDQSVGIGGGTHHLVVVAYESNGGAESAGETITVE